MLRTADLARPITENVVTNHTHSEKMDAGPISFAQSFDEGSEIAWKIDGISHNDFKNIVSGSNTVPVKVGEVGVALANPNTKTSSSTSGIPNGKNNASTASEINSHSENSSPHESADILDEKDIPVDTNQTQKKLDPIFTNMAESRADSSCGRYFHYHDALFTASFGKKDILNVIKTPQQVALPGLSESRQTKSASNNPARWALSGSKKSVENAAGKKKIDGGLKLNHKLHSDGISAAATNTAATAEFLTHTVPLPAISSVEEEGNSSRSSVASDRSFIATDPNVAEPSNGATNNHKIENASLEKGDAKLSSVPDAIGAPIGGNGVIEVKTAPGSLKSLEKTQDKSGALLDSASIHSVATGVIPGGTQANPIVLLSTKAHESQKEPGIANSHINMNANDTDRPTEEMHKILHATPTALEVGVGTADHGWLKVRAEMTNEGLVNTSLAPSSSSVEEMLHRELPSLSSFLRHEQVAVNAVVIHPVSPPIEGIDMTGGGAGDESRGKGQYGQSQGRMNQEKPSSGTILGAKGDEGIAFKGDVRTDDLLPIKSYLREGSWLSIRA